MPERILLCMLSDQLIPNVLSVHHFKPDWIVAIATNEMQTKGVPENFLDSLKLGGLDYRERCREVDLADAADFSEIRRCLIKAFAQFLEGEWIVNLAGGTKPMSIVAHQLAAARGDTMVYLDAQRPDEVINVTSGERQRIQHVLSAAEFLAAYGRSIKPDRQTRTRAEKRARKWWPLSRLLALEERRDAPLRLDHKRRKEGRRSGLELQPGECTVESPDLRSALVEAFALREHGESLVGHLDKYQVEFLTGGWLEGFVWFLLDHHKEGLKISDLGLQAHLCDARGTGSRNEMDVFFVRKCTFTVVECKTGEQEHDPNAQQAMYKLEALVKSPGALRVRTILVSTSQGILDKTTGQVKEPVASRAALFQCHIIPRGVVQELARRWDDGGFVEEKFFGRDRNG